MKVIIPLAGFGTRMRPHTWSRAKPLLNVAGNATLTDLAFVASRFRIAQVRTPEPG